MIVWIIVLVVVLALFGVYLSQVAGRLDRLHRRVDQSLASLDVQLLRRSGAVLDISSSGLIDPVASLVLADSAVVARAAEGDVIERSQHESDLTKALTAVMGSDEEVEALASTEEGAKLVENLSGAVHRAAMSRRFYNDSVRATTAVRRQLLVRIFRLYGHTPWPQSIEMDLTVPEGLQGR